MFRSIKQLSESPWLSARLAFKDDKPREGAERQPTDAERLEALKKSMSADFGKHLDTYSAEIRLFLASDEAEKYDVNEWKQWNVKLLEYMGYKNVSLEDSQGIIRRLQEYLKTLDKNVSVDGKFGPGLLNALKKYYEGQEADRRKSAKVYYVTQYERYYRFPNGTFEDQNGNVVQAKDVIPKITHYESKDKSDPNKIYYGVETQDGKIAYYDAEGVPVEVVEDQPAPAPAPEPKRREVPPTAAELIAQGKIEAAYPVGLHEYIYRTKDNRWVNMAGEAVELSTLSGIIGAEKYAGYYKVKDTNDLLVYIRESDGTVHKGIEVEEGETIAERYARIKKEEEAKKA